MTNTPEYKVTFNVTLLYAPESERGTDTRKRSFASFETTKVLPFLPTRDYYYSFKSKIKKEKSPLGIDTDYNLFPPSEIDKGHDSITWEEKSNSFKWSVRCSYEDTFMLPADLEEYRDEGWKVTRCFINGEKATVDELIAALNAINQED